MKNFIVAASLILAASFAHAEPLLLNKTFSRHLFETEAKCVEAKKTSGGWFNCRQTVSLSPDGSARVMVTDIINPAKYTVEGNVVTVTFLSASEISEPMVFTLTDNKRNLVDAYSQVWEWNASAR